MTEKLKRAASAPITDLIFKCVVVFILPWSVWTTSSIYEFRAFVQRGDRFSVEDGHRLEKVILEQSAKVQQQLYSLEKEFGKEFVRHSEVEGLFIQWSSKNN